MVDKEECRALYEKLKADMADLESISFRKNWFERCHELQDKGCWWHYQVLIRKGRDYLKGNGDYDSYLNP